MSRYGGSFGFGGGMLDEQAAISDRRAGFASQMAEMLARNPDMDPDAAMRMVDNAAGTDNTLRGVISRDAVQSNYNTRQRARRIDMFNAVQAYLKNNPDATAYDAQQALMIFSGGQTDPEILKAFTTQIEADKKKRAIAEQERQLSNTLSSRNQLAAEADRILMQAGDPVKAQQLFAQQFGDNPFGFNASQYLNEQRLGELSKAKALDVYQNISKIAGDTGDWDTALNMYGDTIPQHIRGPLTALVKQQQEARGDKLRSTLAQGLTGFIPNAATMGLDPQNAFSQYTIQLTGKTPAELQKQGVDVSGLQNTFSAALQNERKRLGQTERSQLAQLWTGTDMGLIAEKYLRSGDTQGLMKDILDSAKRNNLTNVTEADVASIVGDINRVYSVKTESKFKELNASVSGVIAKSRDELVRDSTARAKEFFVSEASGKAMGLNSPMAQQFAVALGSIYDFNDTNNLTAAAKVMQQWAQTGQGDLGSLKQMMDSALGTTIEDKIATQRKGLEAQAGTFGQDVQISAADFENSFAKDLDKNVQSIEENFNEIVAGADGTKGAEGVGAAINDLQNLIAGIKQYDDETSMELKARQVNPMWHASGEQIPPDLFPRLAQLKSQKLKAITERAAKKIQELKTGYGDAVSRQSKVDQVNPNINAMKLPASGAPPAAPPPAPSAAATPAGRMFGDALSGLGQAFTSAMTPGPADQRSFRDISGYWLDRGGPAQGWFTQMSDDEAKQAQNIANLMLDRGARSLIADTPAFLDMLDPKSPNFNPGKFLQAWDSIQKTNAAPGTTGQ